MAIDFGRVCATSKLFNLVGISILIVHEEDIFRRRWRRGVRLLNGKGARIIRRSKRGEQAGGSRGLAEEVISTSIDLQRKSLTFVS